MRLVELRSILSDGPGEIFSSLGVLGCWMFGKLALGVSLVFAKVGLVENKCRVKQIEACFLL